MQNHNGVPVLMIFNLPGKAAGVCWVLAEFQVVNIHFFFPTKSD